MNVMRWLRRRQEAFAVAAVADAERDARRRYVADLDAQRASLLARSSTLFQQAMAAEPEAEKRRVYCAALAASARAESLWWLMGDDPEAAAACIVEAEKYDAMAGLPRAVESQPIDAAHA